MADQSIRKKHGRNDDESSKSFKKARIEQVNVRYLSRESFSVFDQIRFRERGNVFIRQSWNNIFNIKIGSSLERYIPKDCHGSTIDTKISTEHGAIFNLEFSPNNQYLVAACENKAILLFDPCSQKRIRIIRNAHKDGVNCVTFLDNRTFATCSDDKNISLWDIRNTRSSIFSLRGHTSWVKSINYNTRTKQLVSSAFDDTIRTWNINDFTNSDNIKGNKVMKIPYLTRTKLMCHNECQKLVAATNTGILFVVHNLKFDTLKVDTSDTMRKLKNIDIDCNDFPVMNLDTHKNVSNRIEFITEFANDVDPWCIASIQIHPQMESILSRYGTKGRQNSEWSTIHSFYEGNIKIKFLFFECRYHARLNINFSI